jgi:PAS domain S-box-containing protein
VKVLYVDDDADDFFLLERQLKDTPVTLRWARTFEEALNAEAADVYLVDYLLPPRTGLELLRELLARDPLTPVILLTGQDDWDIDMAAMESGAADYLVKGRFDPALLERTLRYALAQRRLKSAVASQQRSESRFQAVFHSVMDGLAIADDEGIICEANRAACEILGTARGDLIGSAMTRVTGEIGMLAGERRRVELTRPDGSVRIVDCVTTRMSVPGWLLGLHDVTEECRARDAQRVSEARYQAFMQSSPAPSSIHDSEGRYVEVNEAFCRIVGRRPEEVLGHRCHDLFPSHIAEAMRGHDDMVLTTGQPSHFLELARGEDGRECEWEVYKFVLEGLHGERYVGCTRLDGGETKRLEARLRQAQKMEALGRLAGGVAHDFNNMLTVISGYGELLMTYGGLDEVGRLNLQEMMEAAQRAVSLVRQLLAFSRQQVIEPRILDLNAVIGAMTNMIRRLIGEDIEVEIELREGVRPLRADPGQIEQIVLNLAANARDAMPQGGRLRIETENARMSAGGFEPCAASASTHVLLTVSDTGQGMDAGTLAHIFEPFYTTKRPGEGTGLGLATVYGVVQAARGEILVDSTPGRGACFRIYLPSIKEEVDRAESAARLMPRGNERVLLVEDDPQVRKIGSLMIGQLGYRVRAVGSAQEALDLCLGEREEFDILVTDVVMPHMSGRELADRLLPERPGMRVLYLSGYTDDAILHHGVRELSSKLLSKPFQPEALALKIREVLDAPGPCPTPAPPAASGLP